MVTLCTLLALIAVLIVLGCMYWQAANCLFTFVWLNTSGAFSCMWSVVADLVSELTKDS